MKISIKTLIAAFSIILFMGAGIASATPVGIQAHLWLSTDPYNFDKGGSGYVSGGGGWIEDSYVAGSPFTLYAYNSYPRLDVFDLSLIFAVHNGEVGTVTVNGSSVTGFLTSNNSKYPGGGHDVYDGPSTPISALFYTGVHLVMDSNKSPDTSGALAGSWEDFEIEFSGYSEIHIDAIANDECGELLSYNPGSHDVTGGAPIPEPGTMILLGISLITAAGYMRRVSNKET